MDKCELCGRATEELLPVFDEVDGERVVKYACETCVVENSN